MRNIIKETRKTEKLTQEEYAKRFNISRKTLSEIENGKCNISLDLAFKIASYYSLKVEDIFENIYRFNSKEKFDNEAQLKEKYEN